MDGFRTAVSQDSIAQVEAYIEEQMDLAGVPMRLANRMNVAVDEIYSNIAFYSGADWAEASCTVTDGILTVCLRDNGTPYNPLAKEDPDVTASVDDRKIGGLGIFMAKKLMNDVVYTYSDGQNQTKLILHL